MALAQSTIEEHGGRQEKERHMTTVGDLGRRVSERREKLGLTTETLAIRARMSTDYVRELQLSPSPQISRSALTRLAGALDISVDDLSGSGTQTPPGHGQPCEPSSFTILDRETCRHLIEPGGVGRIVFWGSRGPEALPVNFRTLHGDVVFRTATGPGCGPVSFEVDRLDEALTEGWSVLISGEVRVISDPTERRAAEALGISPWAGGERDVYIRVMAHEVTGRRIRHRP
jgi:nitroimidazol reductase NimA-like FMN-containing flavoprotein (pyridoxamine 5'-phosphate oxidase superfamily)